MGDNSIFKKAQESKNKTEEAMQNEQEYLNNLENTINDYTNGTGTTNPPKDKTEVSTITEKVNKNTLAEDSLGNPITIPEGFKVVPDEQAGVEYTYTGDKKPAVQDGIVIEDEEGNQFVWIPVGKIKNKDNTTTTITLGRYIFNENGAETLIQRSTNYTSTVEDTKIDNFYQELETSDYGNTTAKNLSTFISKTNSNGGYYLARYEASKENENKVKSKSATVWNKITQPDAATAAREMYESVSFESDLVNSYAWDTAIVFIQTYSGDSDYSKEIGSTFSSSLVKTGTNGDKRCNIYDIASNTEEWTTETCSDLEKSCTVRGGDYYGSSIDSPDYRKGWNTSSDHIAISFRPLLYLIK